MTTTASEPFAHDTPSASHDEPVGRPDGGSRAVRVEQIFNELSIDTLDLVDGFYHERVEFVDPIASLTGRDAVRDYYANLYQHVESIRFDFSEIVEQGDTVVAVWTMYLNASGLNRGRTIELPGVSHLRFDGKTDLVMYHRDYFDMGAFVYQHVPVLSAMVRFVNHKLHPHAE